MKNSIVNKITAVFLTLIMVFGLIPSAGFAQSNPASPLNEVKGFNMSVFDSHFSRADREINPERWLAEAKIGITQAVYAWELVAFGIYENPFVFDEAKAKLEDWSNKELEARFSQWLIKRFFGEAFGKAISDFSAMLGETQKKYTWRLDDDGNVVFDEKTGDPLVIRPGEEGREFTQDRIIWRDEAEELVEKNGGLFDAAMINMYPELLAYIPAELRESMSAAIKEAGAAASAGIRREFENIAAREQRIFTSRRTRDIWSLRKKSDDEAARIFTEQLITETGQECAKGINELNAKIEQAYAGTGDLALLGEEWLQLYKEQFDRGLKAWEEAEERFFIRRIEWEQDSIRLFSEGEEIWLAAFDKFDEEYQKWELKAKELFNTGEQLFKNISDNLEKNISDAKAEFEINKNMRVGSGTEKVKALIDMYLTGASAAISAKENVQFWMKYYQEEKNVNDPGFADWLLTERNNLWIQLEELYAQAPGCQSSLEENNLRQKILSQIQDVISGKMTFDEEQSFAKELAFAERLFFPEEDPVSMIDNNSNLSVINKNYSKFCDIQKYYNLYTSYLEIALEAREKILADYAEILGTGVLNDILSPGAATEDFYLDEYQLALVRAKTLVLYWERKTSIAEAVMSYSEKIDAGRMTEAESIQAWEKAKTVYYKSLASYEAELKKLSEIGVNIQNQKNILDELAKKMSEEEEKLSRLSREYSMLVARSYASIWSIAEMDFNNRYKFLAEEYKYFLKTGDRAAYKDVLDYGMKWGIAQQKEDVENLLAILVNGDNSDTPSLAELEDSVLIKTRLAAIDLFADGQDYKLRPLNSVYSGADWYSKAKGIELSKEEKTALYGEKLGERLVADFNKSHMALLEKRLDFELEALKSILETDIEATGYENAMENTVLSSVEDVSYIYNILFNLKKRLNLNQGFFTEDNEENEVLEYFVLMGSFSKNKEENLIDYYNDYNYCSNLLDLYNNYAAISSFGQKENWQNSCNNIKTFLAGYRIETGNKFLPEAQSIYEAILRKGGNLSENVILFFDEFQNYFSLIPKWLENEIFLWKNAVIEYISVNISSYENGANNEKNWRQFLNEKNINTVDPVLAGVSTRKEGIIEDARFAAAYYTNRLNDAINLFSQNISYTSTQTAQTLYNYYSYASSNLDNRFYSLNFYYDDISRLGRALEISKFSQSEADAESIIVYKALKDQEEIFNLSRDNYFTEAEIFLNIGGLYDSQYSVVKNAYDDTEAKRFEYEKEDAIRRWASTAYLNTDSINYNDCRNKLDKAQIALTVLLDINKEKHDFDNPEYNALYSEYEKSFLRKIKTLEAFDAINASLANEYNYNDSCYNTYKYYLFTLGALNSVENINDWPHKDIVTVKDGKLAFSKDSSWDITANSNTGELDVFFNSLKKIDGERIEISPFEEALRGLSQRMEVYLNDPEKLKQWSLAREYILYNLILANSELFYLTEYLSGLGELGIGGSLGNELYKVGALKSPGTLNSYFEYYSFFNVNVGSIVYESFSETEKADLEFFMILTLTGNGNNYISGFSEMLPLDIYQLAFNMVFTNYLYAANQKKKWYTFSFYNGMNDINFNTLIRIDPVLNYTRTVVNNFIYEMNSNITAIKNYGNEYFYSCNNLRILNGEKEAGQSVVWKDIEEALTMTEKFNNEDISVLKDCWDKMQEKSFVSYNNVNDALSGLLLWTRSEEKRTRNDLEKILLAEMQKQQNNENNYLAAVEAYFSGTGNIKALKAAAENAYGKNNAVQKNHLENLHSTLINNFSVYLTMENDHYSEFASLGNELQLITEKTLENRYEAEFEARKIEWNQMQADILVKANEWQNSISLILERGRSDWDAGKQKMNETYNQWYTNFQNEVQRVENEWAEAYLAGLEDKEKWLEQAAEAFNQASEESFLQLVGTEGERLSKFMDIREPFDIRNAVPEAQAIMTELLQSSGIVNMTNAFSYMNNIADASAFKVRKGLGGVSSWDAAVAKAAAKDIAKKTNEEIADAETRKLAHTARITVSEVINKLYSSVDDANKNFRESMDNQFIMEGLWRMYGTNYVKDIVKGSTLFHPVITSTQVIEGYKNYIMEPVSLKTNLDENYLSKLNTFAVRALIESAYNEVEVITKDVLGIGKDKIIIKKENLNDREQSPGKFGAHLGFEPALKPSYFFGDTKESIFFDEGKGELGRLFSEFIYWKIIDEKGSAEISLPPWEKRMWNDENSKFSAPSLSKTVKIAGAVVASVAAVALSYITGGTSLGLLVGTAALVAGINSSNDFLFSSLNFAFGYQSFKEAGFDFAKASLINCTSAAISGAFGSFGGGLTSAAVGAASSTTGKIATQTVMTGLQSVTSSVATNALNSFTFNNGHIGWSKEIFSSGMKDLFTDTMVSMASTFTTQSLTAVNSGLRTTAKNGFEQSKLIGFNPENKLNINNFNNLAGSLVGQGVNYAMGNDFTLNLLNLSLITNGDKYNSGLLELHLGRDGTSMNLGTGGANASIDNLLSTFKGIQVWNVNGRINSLIKKEDDFDSAIALRSLYGFGDDRQKNLLWDILNGKKMINAETERDYIAESVKDNNGKTVINLPYQSGMSKEDQLLLGIILGQEAYRDADVTNNDEQKQETRTAALAHTEMAIRMIQGGYTSLFNNMIIKNDIIAYNIGKENFYNYVNNSYDSSGDFWKLQVCDGIAGFIWDGKYTYDLSIMKGYGVVDKLDEDAIWAMWNLGGDKTFEELILAVRTFDTLNERAIVLEKSLSENNKNNATTKTVNKQLTDFMNAIKTVDSSGLLIRTNANIVNPGKGPSVFADGIATLTSDYGIRAIDWGIKFGGIQWHGAWDLSKRGDLRLVAPMDGALSLEFTQGGGLKIVTTGEDNQKITYAHTDSLSLVYFLEAFSSNGVTLSDGKLNGIMQNMVIGKMGNTGTETTGAHVHLTYEVNGKENDPALFFDKSKYTSDLYTKLMSGLSKDSNINNFQYSTSQIKNIYNYFYTTNKTNYVQKFSAFAPKTNQVLEFNTYLTNK